MPGMNFQYDETGGTFYYFLVSFYALALIPFSLWVLKKKGGQDSRDKDKTVCHCEPCGKKNSRLSATKPREKIIQRLLYIVLILAWLFFAWAAYRVSHIKTDHVEYDPYEVLGVDRGATDREIKKKYRDLTRTHHPDKGGDEEVFRKIAKAYAALTDEESRKNWEEYGNPDGPGAMQFGIALPKWLVEGSASTWVLMAYVAVFMVFLPTVVGMWWYKSIKYSGDKILLPTQQLYFYFINKTPNMMFKRALMVLSGSLEFWKKHNAEVVERPSDDEEVRVLMRMVSSAHLNEKNKEPPLCYPYSIKSRALLLAQMQREKLNPNTLLLDLLYILSKCPLLINEMVQITAQLVAMHRAGQVGHKPRLDTVENIMKMSPLLVQALWENSSPLLMLPHISEQQLKNFVNKKRAVRNIRQFCQLSDDDRRSLLRHIEDQEYRNIMNVLQSMPAVTMDCHVKVLDEEESDNITAGSIVTVTVSLLRESMLEKYGKSLWNPEEENNDDVEAIGTAESPNDNDEEKASEAAETEEEGKKKTSTKIWESNKKSKKSKGGKKKKQNNMLRRKADRKSQNQNEKEEAAEVDKSVADKESEHEESETEHDRDESEMESSTPANGESKQAKKKSGEEDDDWHEFEFESKKHKLKTTSMKSHTVHCPFFPSDKQEYWWLYVADKKRSDLITVPVRITNLVDKLDIDVQFAAPSKPGSYTYTMCLKSDSYVDTDLYQTLKMDVKEAKIIESHPQWDISDDEEDKNKSGSEDESSADDSEFEYDDDD